MATDAFRIAMLAQQRVIGLLVVVENNFLPALFVMANFALGSEIPLVLVVFLVTGVAIHLELVLIQIALVAIVALDIAMFPKQREFGLPVMIERDFLPAALNMAGLAFRPKLALVLVVFLMA